MQALWTHLRRHAHGPRYRGRRLHAGVCAALMACGLGPARAEPIAGGFCTDPTHAHTATTFSGRAQPTGAAGAVDGRAAPALVARYRVTLLEAHADGRGREPLREQHWTFVRSADRVAIDKGAIEEIWQRLPNGAVALQRVLHDPQRVVDYSAGELVALGIEVDWAALSTFAARPEPRRPARGAVAASASGAAVDDAAWDGALQLPIRLEVSLSATRSLRYELIEWASRAHVDWPLPGSRSGSYEHIDAADLGDLPGDPAARLAEALDVRAGWRRLHLH